MFSPRRLFARLRDLVWFKKPELRQSLEVLIEESHRSEPGAGLLDDERALLVNILKLRDQTAYDVMVPRAEIVSVEVSTGLDDLRTVVLEEAHSRLPVYRETLDDVIGMIHIKDVLAQWGHEEDFDLSDAVRDVLIVAPSMRVLDLLVKMRISRTHMAMVVDEYGGIDGLVTIEDLVETIVGEIEDEFDEENADDLLQMSDGTFLADARAPLDKVEEVIGPFLTEEQRDEDIETVGGLVFTLLGRVPSRGELVTHLSGIGFEVLEADPRRIKRIRIRRRVIGPPTVPPTQRQSSGGSLSDTTGSGIGLMNVSAAATISLEQASDADEAQPGAVVLPLSETPATEPDDDAVEGRAARKAGGARG